MTPRRARRHLPGRRALGLAALAAGTALAAAAPAAAAPPDVSLGFVRSAPGTIVDKDGQGTGFTTALGGAGRVVAGNLDVAGGALHVTTTGGDALANTQQNGLAVGFDGSSDYRVGATLRGPLALTGGSQGAGIFVGAGEDSYVKITAGRAPDGTPRIQMLHEGGGGGGTINKPVPAVGAGSRIDLTLEVDADTTAVTGYYSVNGGPATAVGTRTLAQVGDASDAAGLLTTNSGTSQATTFVYDAFVVEPKVPIAFQSPEVGHAFSAIAGDPLGGKQFPTSVAVGPAGKLYAASQYGRIHVLNRDADDDLAYVKQLPNIFNVQNQGFGGSPAGEKGRLVTGIVVDPASSASNQILYVSHSDPQIFEEAQPGQSTVYPASGRITKLVLDGAGNVKSQQDIVVGLPRSAENHGPNGMAFGPDGWLYIGLGGNTNAGGQSLEFGYFPEVPLAGAVARVSPAAIGSGPPVDVTSLSAFSFTDPCAPGETVGSGCSAAASVATLTPSAGAPTPIVAGKLELYATGFRNPYDLAWHSNGKLYLNENEHNAEFGNTPDASTPPGTCPGPAKNPGTPPDHLEHVLPGTWYGHPNPSRGAGECQLNGGKQPIASYSAVGLGSEGGARSSTSGLAEYT